MENLYAQVKNLVSTTLEKFGRLDFLVNNGGGRIRTLGFLYLSFCKSPSRSLSSPDDKLSENIWFVSRHLKGRSGPRVGNVFGPNIPKGPRIGDRFFHNSFVGRKIDLAGEKIILASPKLGRGSGIPSQKPYQRGVPNDF